jgi:hypothetical protein
MELLVNKHKIERWTRAVMLTVFISVGGCAHSEIRGVVQSMPSERPGGGLDPGGRTHGAKIFLACPAEADRLLAVSDDQGQFYYQPEKPVDFNCSIRVTRNGYIPRDYPIEAACVWPRSPEGCDLMGLTARLLPKGEQQ